MGILYIISTPIGNLQDITLRAINLLKSADIVLCEDTRVSGFLLKKISEGDSGVLEEKSKLISFYEENERLRIPMVIQLLKEGNHIALISDSGTPLISDPGFKLVRECIKNGIKISSIPGPSSVISALVVSGLPTDKFLFLGFLPKKSGHRKKALKKISSIVQTIELTIILFESPHRLLQTLREMKDIFGDADIVVCRELTKIHEEVRRNKISSLIALYSALKPKGEIVVLFNLKEQTAGARH